ncbi:Tripartite tricarboxylate transporter family receptor [Hoeflea sp. IMCC20628]|uniref:Bug family tripartite tricarboxylate transporter substrate binding protein n=1 Tax=Hoeflea sp. IMCC20628 TaxID=1620421 RepID=UPI00063BD55F|nr:tripartite tricarboxylate transporter substrate-binding protein [Hoeflea sp. IMCC20628]AKI00723.1 Tripartite tricarboxylate transporter family receptor [Hoeflea sp. IMCC20628]
MTLRKPTRREFIGSAFCAPFATSLGVTGARSDTFPSRNINITVPTGEGGGSDRDARLFTEILKTHLDTNFEFGFYPGASGQVGYEFYMNNREPDCHNLIVSFMGAEVIVLTLQAPHIQIGRDITFFQQIMSEPMAIFSTPDSGIATLEDLVKKAQQEPMNIAVPRLPHTSSIGMLALGEATGAEFNLIPYGGGGPTAMAVVTGEVPCAAMGLSTILSVADKATILGIFDNVNPIPDITSAPLVNDVFGSKIPPLKSGRSWAIHTKAIEDYPDRFEILKSAIQKTATDPAYADAVAATGVPRELIYVAGQEETMEFADNLVGLANRYKSLLSAG